MEMLVSTVFAGTTLTTFVHPKTIYTKSVAAPGPADNHPANSADVFGSRERRRLRA
jgi:hypothetical protein